MSKTLERIRSDKRVEFVDDERNIGNGVIVTLHYGFHGGEPGCHVFGEDTVTDAFKHMRQRVKPCVCPECAS